MFLVPKDTLIIVMRHKESPLLTQAKRDFFISKEAVLEADYDEAHEDSNIIITPDPMLDKKLAERCKSFSVRKGRIQYVG